MKRNVLIAAIVSGLAALSACSCLAFGTGLKDAFASLPEGTDPATVSRRITDQFLTTRPENYKPAAKR